MIGSLPEQWLQKASEDLAVARVLLREDFYSQVCFYAQQCIEKVFKGFLLARTNNYPRVHRLEDLQSKCEGLDITFAQFLDDCLVVDQYYTPTRYPDAVPGGLPFGLPDVQDAKEALEIADKIFHFVQEKLASASTGSTA